MTRPSRRLRPRQGVLYVNAYALVANQVMSAGLGFLYWLLAARLHGVTVVGRSSAAISTLLLLAGLAQFGLGSGMNRFLPRAGRHARRLIAASYAVVISAAAVFALLYLPVSRLLGIQQQLVEVGVGPLWVVVATVLWSVFYFQDGVLIGLHRAPWVFLENMLYNAAKVVVLVLTVGSLGHFGIIGSWFLPTPVAILLVAWLVFTRFTGRGAKAGEPADDSPRNDTPRLTVREIVTSVTGDHVGSLVAESAVRVLPVVVLAEIGASSNAYFYQAWTVAATLTLISSGMTNSFTAEAAGDPLNIPAYSRGILVHMARLVLPVAAIVGIGAPLVLSLFGPVYAAQGTGLLRWLVLATPLVIFNNWYLSYLRVLGRIRRVVVLQVLTSVLLVALTASLLRPIGIVAAGIAWLVAQGAVFLLGAGEAIGVLSARPRPAHAGSPGELVAALQRADFRFLLPRPDLASVAVLGDGPLADAVDAVRAQAPTADRETPHAAEADASDPRTGTAGSDTAVLHDPKPRDYRAAYDAVRPGGAVYCELSGPGVRRARAAARRLSAAGFRDVEVWWPAPRAAAARLWLRLRPQHSRDTATVADVLSEGVESRWLRAAASVTARLVMLTGLAPDLALTARRPAEDGQLSQPSFPRHLTELVSEAVPGVDPDSVSLVMRTGGDHIENKINWPMSDASSGELRWIAKAGRHPAAVATLRAERDALVSLAARDAARGPTVPSLIAWDDTSGVRVSIQTGLAGHPLHILAPHVPFDEVARLATDSLADLAGRPRIRPRAEWQERHIERWCDRLESVIDRGGEPGLVQAVRAAAAGLGDLPLVPSHNDCAAWNAVVHDGRLGLFDWECYEPTGLPLVDLVYLLSTTAFCADATAGCELSVRSYRELLDERDPRGAVFQECLSAYAERVGVPDRDVPLLRMMTWVVHATQDLENAATGSIGATRRALEESSCLPLLRAELARQSPSSRVATRPGRRPVIVISPHLDDAALSCGAGIRRLTDSGEEVLVVTCCTEDRRPDVTLTRLARTSHMAWGLDATPFAQRREEDADAMRMLGATPVNLGLCDAIYRVTAPGRPLYGRYVTDRVHPADTTRFLPELTARLDRLLSARPAARVFCPAGVGGHPDHTLVRQAVEALCEPGRIVYYEEYPYVTRTQDSHPAMKSGGATWVPHTLHPTPLELESRLGAIACYGSQLRGLFPSLGDRIRLVVAARAPMLERVLLGGWDGQAARARTADCVAHDVKVSGGERYWWPTGEASPFDASAARDPDVEAEETA